MRKTHEQFIKEMNNLNPNIEILETYVTAKTKLKCKCKKHLFEWSMDPDHLLRGQGCPICGKESTNASHKKKTHEQFIADCGKKNPKIKIIGRYTGILDPIECKCIKCNGVFIQKASKAIEGVGCPYCSSTRVCKGLNDIATTNPEIVKYFKYKEDAYKYTKGSAKRTIFKCPDCGYEKEVVINNIYKYGSFLCPKCSDGISYPNKFSRAMLDQLPVSNVIYEYSPEWAKPYRYDNYFEYNGEKYILEMDGGFHYIKCYKSNLPLEETRRIDSLKTQLAIDNNVNIIRIDCFYSNCDYITKSVLSSELAQVFDLSKIDWGLCNNKATKSIVKMVCDLYNDNPEIRVKEIADKLHLRESTISEYLYKGNELGFCKYKPWNKLPIAVKINDKKYIFDTVNQGIRVLSKIYKNVSWSKFKTATQHRESTYGEFSISYL